MRWKVKITSSYFFLTLSDIFTPFLLFQHFGEWKQKAMQRNQPRLNLLHENGSNMYWRSDQTSTLMGLPSNNREGSNGINSCATRRAGQWICTQRPQEVFQARSCCMAMLCKQIKGAQIVCNASIRGYNNTEVLIV